MSIGEVLAHLRVEFPDTTISKLRFLEAEGLVEPQRTPSGYRKYSWDDVARLRFVLTAQRDQYLPLRVIREQLADLAEGRAEPGRQRPALVAVGPSGEVSGRSDAEPVVEAETRLSRADLVGRSGIDEATLAELERLGIVVSSPPGWYDADALAIAQAVAGLARYGLEPRHLRGYRTAADREVGLFAQLIAPLARQNDPAARARAAETARELVALSQQLHAALVRVGLRDVLGR
ncbi:MerR family transcriptional regulator [Micromonospora zhanjiangensis]|uniref:MerR family transcriptional regulator n=1 Tax=Micromonospora zhanjiangensis TaxID=1522057 RepID=A0ABV8KVM5_9ACTN